MLFLYVAHPDTHLVNVKEGSILDSLEAPNLRQPAHTKGTFLIQGHLCRLASDSADTQGHV